MVAQPGRDGDYCLTTFLSALSFCIHFHAPTFFYRHSNQRRNLCKAHKFLRCIILYRRMSQFSDPKGRRFESCQPHQKGRCTAVQRPFYFGRAHSVIPPHRILPGRCVVCARTSAMSVPNAAKRMGLQADGLPIWRCGRERAVRQKQFRRLLPIRQTRHPAKPHGFVRRRVLL